LKNGKAVKLHFPFSIFKFPFYKGGLDSLDFGGLSDTLESKELAGYFRQFFEIYGGKPKSITALKELYELAYRQWDTYEPLEEEISHKVSDYLVSAIQFNSYDIMDTILSIVENLSLKNTFEYIVDRKDDIHNPSVRLLVDEAEKDYSDTIGNPFECIE